MNATYFIENRVDEEQGGRWRNDWLTCVISSSQEFLNS